MAVMMEAEVNGERLSEVSRLADVLADQILRESMIGQASMTKLTALGKAALLLQDYDQPVPDLVADVLTRATQGEDADDARAGDGHVDEAAFDADDLEADPDGREARRRLLPRLMQSLRLPRG
jgi:hypothetical protein